MPSRACRRIQSVCLLLIVLIAAAAVAPALVARAATTPAIAAQSASSNAIDAKLYPQNRYGHHPDDIKYRFPRQTVVMVSPHNPKVVYQASHVLHRSIDDGVTWDVISPDLTAHEKEYQIVPGNPITRDVTGEEVYSSIYSMGESKLERGVLWVGANDGPVRVRFAVPAIEDVQVELDRDVVAFRAGEVAQVDRRRLLAA